MIREFNVIEKFNLVNAYWTPKIVGELNGQLVKLAKAKGEFIWHDHEKEDEMFIIYKGTLFVDFKDKTTETKQGEVLIIPKGVAHRPRTNGEEVWIMLIEPQSTKHTGNVDDPITVKELDWI